MDGMAGASSGSFSPAFLSPQQAETLGSTAGFVAPPVGLVQTHGRMAGCEWVSQVQQRSDCSTPFL